MSSIQLLSSDVGSFSKRMPIDVKILATFLEDHGKLDQVGGASYIVELTLEVPTATHVLQYAL